MNKLKGALPMIAFVFAAFAALAFNSPKEDREYGQGGDIWYDVTDTDPGVNTYQCEAGSQHCLYDDPSVMGNPISGPNQKFVVKNASNLTPA